LEQRFETTVQPNTSSAHVIGQKCMSVTTELPLAHRQTVSTIMTMRMMLKARKTISVTMMTWNITPHHMTTMMIAHWYIGRNV